MTKRRRRRFSPEEKVSILKRHLLDGLPVSDVCGERGLHPNQFYTWHKQFFDRGAATFTPNKTNAVERKRRKLWCVFNVPDNVPIRRHRRQIPANTVG